MTTSFARAGKTLLDYSGLVLGVAECIYLKKSHKTKKTSEKLDYIFKQINKLKANSYGRESVLRYFNFELDVSLLEKLAIDLKDKRQSLEHLGDDVSSVYESLRPYTLRLI